MGLRSANPLEQQAAVSALSNLMSIIPGDTYTEFEKVDSYFCMFSLFLVQLETVNFKVCD